MSDNLENTALKEAHGVYNDGVTSKNARYDLYMDYDNMHNIVSKKQQISQTGVQFAGSLNAGYELNYTINAHNSQQIANIADESYRYEGTKLETPPAAAVVKKSQVYSYDANGNMTFVASGKLLSDSTLQATNTRKLMWDEENRLLAISDNGFVSNYWYDAAGERTVKQSGGSEGVFVNGVLSGARTETGKFTAYISPYMVVSNGGNYSKHIYMGSQRIVSKLSNSGIFAASPVTATQQQAKYALQSHKIKERSDSLEVVYNGTAQTGGLISSNPASTAGSYFYHPDHLGSSSLITDGTGALTQHIRYVPFGEVFVEERTNSWSTPYKFNGKELDEETGLYYYHARYYDPRLSVWLSVDPLAEEYPNISSYVYCVNNPVKYVDPDGMRLRVANNETFSLLLSSLPNTARDYIRRNRRGFITLSSVNKAIEKAGESGNLQALKTIVADKGTVVLDATKSNYKYIDAESGKTEDYSFAEPRTNDLEYLLNKFQGSEVEKQMYAEYLMRSGVTDSDVAGNLGATLRPKSKQSPYPGGQISTSNNYEVYISPVGTSKLQKLRNIGHELFSHLYFFLIGKDPRHGGETQTINGNPLLERQIIEREMESERNSQN